MYTLVSAIGKLRGGTGRWGEVSIGSTPLVTIYANHTNVIATLSNNFLDHNVALDLASIQAQYGSSDLTFNQMLAALGNGSLPTTDTLPVLSPVYAKYADAFRAQYKVAPVHPVFSPDADLPPSELTWLHLTRPETDYALFGKHCMVSVNGFYHLVDASAQGIYVKEGNQSRTISGCNEIGIVSFLGLGEIEQIPITPEMVYKQTSSQRLRDRAFIDLGVDISNKTLILVLGGYMHIRDPKTFFRVAEDRVAIDFNNLPLFDRYLESRGFIDLSALPMERTVRNDSQFAVDDFLSDENLLAYLTLSQSFFVVVDHPDLFVSQVPIHPTKMPGMLISYTLPKYPLVIGHGRHANYWQTYEDTQWSVTVRDSYRHNRLFHTVDAYKQDSLSDSRVPYTPVRNSLAHFLQIGRDI